MIFVWSPKWRGKKEIGQITKTEIITNNMKRLELFRTLLCPSLNCITNLCCNIKKCKLWGSHLLPKNNLQRAYQVIFRKEIEKNIKYVLITSQRHNQIAKHQTRKANHIGMGLEGALQSNMGCLPAHESDKIIILEQKRSYGDF